MKVDKFEDDPKTEILQDIRYLMPFIVENEKEALVDWNNKSNVYLVHKGRFDTNPSARNAKRFQAALTDLYELEVGIKSIISSIYLSTPNPSEAEGMWDRGKEKSIRLNRISALESIAQQVCHFYTTAKLSENSLREFIKKQAHFEVQLRETASSDLPGNTSLIVQNPKGVSENMLRFQSKPNGKYIQDASREFFIESGPSSEQTPQLSNIDPKNEFASDQRGKNLSDMLTKNGVFSKDQAGSTSQSESSVPNQSGEKGASSAGCPSYQPFTSTPFQTSNKPSSHELLDESEEDSLMLESLFSSA
ncbi:hypothetical protein FKG94_07585 [Exilibacterium tricleocarpae]|uniref:Uncharacterized protein n=1 Tax=Exilibacterium tricleocarpae TaxID=2591008 RepID=A0A545TZE3_9GAMM|nr:hypothetical protein [Exilibacterium tricleocarpae]TQV82585.1 hypothetical protein FKG94_07585 [Exilibacterium tricleocarpae]